MNIGDIWFALRGEAASTLEVDAIKAGQAAGETAAGSFSEQFKKKLIKSGIGAAAGLALGVTLKQGAALDDAARTLAADTGMMGAEADKAKAALAGVWSDNVLGWTQLGDTMAKVHNDLGLTGTEMDNMTAKFAKWETATRQGSEAVSLMDDVLDNWNLTASSAGIVMDKLITSQHKFGGDIAGNEVTLAKLAPAMRAANFQIDDGIALLGLFGAKGLDSERAAAAFSKALTKVKSPAELRKLIADISAQPDAFKRASMAADLFGTKAGAQLANALGGANLDDYKISVDEARGATERAAEASLSWSDRATIAFHKISAPLAEIGQAFGPLLIVGNMFGPKMAAAISSGVGALVAAGTANGAATGAATAAAEAATVAAAGPEVAAGVAAQGPAAAAAGAGVGRLIGMAMGAAIPLAIVGITVGVPLLVFNQVEGGLQSQADALEEKAKAWGKAATDAELAAAKTNIEAERDKVPTIFGWDAMGGKAKVQQTIDAITAEIVAREIKGLTAGEVKDKLAAAQADITSYLQNTNPLQLDENKLADAKARIDALSAAYQEMGGDAAIAEQAAADEAEDAALATRKWQQTMAELGGKARKSLAEVVSAWRSAKEQLTSIWSGATNDTFRPQEIALEKQQNLAEQAEIKALMADRKKWSKLAASEQVAKRLQLLNLTKAYRALEVEDATYGTNAEKIVKLNGLRMSKAMAEGLASMDPAVRAEWQLVKLTTETALQDLYVQMANGGDEAAKRFLRGLSLENHETSTHRPGQGFASGTSYVPRAGVYDVGEMGRERVFLPEGAAVAPHSQVDQAARGGDSYTFNGITDRRTAIDTMRDFQLRKRVGEFG